MTTVKVPSLSEFWEILAKHDWFFYFSDDRAVERKGEESQRRIEAIIWDSKDVQYSDLYARFYASVMNKTPRPERPSEAA